MKIQELMMSLAKKRISTSIHYDSERQQCYVDLHTQAKSHLHLYEDGVLRGRYEFEKKIDFNQDVELLITQLCHEFNDSLHGRNYCNDAWEELCRSKGIVLEMYGI